MVNTKKCFHCEIEKPVSEFNKYSASKDGLRHICRSCQKAVNKRTYDNHRESRQARARDYYANRADKNRLREYSKQYHAKYAAKVRDKELQTVYGISLEEYNKLLFLQGGGCAICGMPPGARHGGRRLGVDHCHATGKIRGILCSSCNLGIGKFHDDPSLLAKAFSYLTNFQS